MENERLDIINRFLSQYGLSFDTISKSRMEQFEKVDYAIQDRLNEINHAKEILRRKTINVTTISNDTGIARKTFYNNDLLRLYVESFSTESDNKMTAVANLERLKEKYDEAERQIKLFLLRDIDIENLRNENTKLQAEIQNLENRNRTLEEQFEKIQAELNGQKMSHKIVMIDKSDVN